MVVQMIVMIVWIGILDARAVDTYQIDDTILLRAFHLRATLADHVARRTSRTIEKQNLHCDQNKTKQNLLR